MATNLSLLRSLVFEKYNTRTEFANNLGWNKNKVSALFNGKLNLDEKEMLQIANLLEIHTEELFLKLFFPSFFSSHVPDGDKTA